METQEFGVRLRELRIQAHLTQRELAEKVSVDFSYLSKIENGVLPPPSEKVILRLAEVLNVDKDELITLAGRIPSDIAQMLKNRKTLQLLRSERIQKKVMAKKGEGGHILKRFKSLSKVAEPINYKSLARVAVAIILVIAVGTSLWFASPTQALTIDVSTPSPTVLGQTISFSVTVNIEDTELLPIESVDLAISKDNFATYEDWLANLPLTQVTNQTYTSGQGNTVTITATVSNWAFGYGYGYALWQGTPYYFGYGYGYGPGAASITYNVNWTTPTTWTPATTYRIGVSVTANGEDFQWGSDEFTLTRPPVVAPVEVVYPEEPPPEPGVTDVSGIVNGQGVFTESITARSADGKVKLTIDEGTTGKTKEDQPLTKISIVAMEEPPGPPPSVFIGLTYDLGPDGATFTPPILLTFIYDQADVPEGANEENLVIAFWDEDTGEWVVLEGITVDPAANVISARVTNFTAFAVIAHMSPAAFTVSALTISPAEVNIGESVSISVTLTNIGDLTGSSEVTLKIDNVVIDTKIVTLAGQASQTVTFTTTKDAAGSYAVNINGLPGTFIVKAPPPVVAPPPPVVPPPPVAPPPVVPPPVVPVVNWWLIGGIIAAVIIISVVVWLVVARRRV